MPDHRKSTHRPGLTRRGLLAASAAAPALALVPGAPRAQDTVAAGADGTFRYEVERSEADWRARLTEAEFNVLRGGETEFPFTSPYARENADGVYACRGCGLPLYRSDWYSPQEIGFVFFYHSEPNAVLTGIHTSDYNGALKTPKVFMEVHCRRCGSHLGHFVSVKQTPLHCINGTALSFSPKNEAIAG